MSFIFQDKNFLKLIYKMAENPYDAAADATKNIVQEDLVVSPISEEIVSKFFDSLKQEAERKKFDSISGEPKPVSAGGETKPSTSSFNQPSVQDLSNLKSFINFCDFAGVKVGDKRIINEVQDSAGTLKQDAGTKKFIEVPGMSTYLEFLKSSDDYGTNRIYTYMLGELIGDFNKAFGGTVSRIEDTIIAPLSRQVDIALALDKNRGDINLKIGDLMDFPKWFQNSGISVKNGTQSISDKPECALLKYLYERPESEINQNIKTRIKSCGSRIGCPVESWSTTTSQAASGTAAPGAQQPGATAGAPGNLSTAGVQARDKLIAMLNNDGPFEKDQIRIGTNFSEKTIPNLISFANNAQIYFEEMGKALSMSQYNDFARTADEAANGIWYLYKATRQGLITLSTTCPTLGLTQSQLDWIYANAKIGMDNLYSVVEQVCELTNLKEKLPEQNYRYRNSKSIIGQVSLSNQAAREYRR